MLFFVGLASTAQAAGPGNDRPSQSWHAGTSSGTLYVALENQGLWKTVDAGTNWTQVGQSTLGGYVNAVYFSTALPQAVCAAKDGVPYYSMDGGATWQLNNWAVAAIGTGYVDWFSGANSDASLRLAVVDHRKVYQALVTLSGDLSSVTNMAVTDISAGLPANIVINNAVRLDGSGNMLLATNQGVFRRIKNNANWAGVTSTWTAINTGLDSTDLNISDVRPWGTMLTAISQRNAWASADNGATWGNASGNLPVAPSKLWTTTDTTYNGVYVTLYGYGIYKTTDGVNWTSFVQAVPGETLTNFSVVGTSTTGTKLIGYTSRGVYVANNPSSAWQPAGGFTPNNGCTDPTVVSSMQAALDSFSQGNFTALGQALSSTFLDDGQNAATWLAGVQTQRSSMPANVSIKMRHPLCSISADGNSAFVVSADATYIRNSNETGPLYLAPDDGSDEMALIKEGGVWKFNGNQLSTPIQVNLTGGVSTDITTGNPPSGWGSWVSYWIPDNTHQFTGVTVSGPGISGTQALAYDSNQMAWQAPCGPTSCSPAMASFTSTDPTNNGANPLTYTFVITPQTGTATTLQRTLKGPFLTQGPKLLMPQVFNNQTQLNLLMPTSANYQYNFQLSNSQGTQVGNANDVLNPSVSVPLVPAGSYSGNIGAYRHADKKISYMANASFSTCFDGSKWTPGACGSGSTTTTSTSTTTSSTASTTTTSVTGTTTTTTASTTTTTQRSVGLTNGWNLIGNGYTGSINVTAVFDNNSMFDTVWKWIRDPNNSANDNKWGFFTPNGDKGNGVTITDYGAAYAVQKGYVPLTTINAGEGFWVRALTAMTVPQPTGTAIASTSFANLVSDWSLISVGDNPTAAQFNVQISATPPAPGTIPSNVLSLWAWDATAKNWYFYDPVKDANGTLADYITSKQYLNFTTNSKTLAPGVGFWVRRP